VLTCFIIGVLATLQVYAAQLVWGDWKGFPDVDTAFVHVAGRAGGAVLFGVVSAALLIATIGSGTGAHLGAARLLYGMGRSGALFPSFFGAIDPRTRIPRNNVLFVGALAFVGGLLLSFQLGAEMLNFGAFIAFMGVNLAAFTHYWLRGDAQAEPLLDRERAIHSTASDSGTRGAQPEHRKKARRWQDFVLPLLGFFICFYLWLSLRWPAKLAGGAWLAVGIAYGAWKTRGFRRNLVSFELPPE
jgi:putrescine importer